MKETISTHLREIDGVLEIYLGNRLFVEVHDGKHTEKFVEDVLYGMGYDWLEDGTIRPRVELPITKESIYDEMCRVLTNYENSEDGDRSTEYDLYEMLVKIQNNWEAVITAQEEN